MAKTRRPLTWKDARMERLKPPTISYGTPSGNALTTHHPKVSNCSLDEALGLAGVILGCYKKSDCADPEIFAAATVSVLSRFPADVAKAVADPYSGLPSRLKWFPAIQEIREACEAESSKIKHRVEAVLRVNAQFSERDRVEAMGDGERRKAFIKTEMAKIERLLAGSSTALEASPIDIRNMEESDEKRRLRKILDAEMSRKSADSQLKPCAPLGSWRASKPISDSEENAA